MTCPLIYFTNGCCDHLPNPYGINSMMKSAALFDTFATLSCLVAGILGALSVIGIGPAASYALLGTSAAITMSWMTMILHNACSEPED